MEYAGRITVEDTRGSRLQVHEYRGRRFFKQVRRFLLETGEPVERLDCDHYMIAGTREKLIRVD